MPGYPGKRLLGLLHSAERVRNPLGDEPVPQKSRDIGHCNVICPYVCKAAEPKTITAHTISKQDFESEMELSFILSLGGLKLSTLQK